MSKTVVVLEGKDRVSIDRASSYEISNAITTRLPMFVANNKIYTDAADIMISVAEMSDVKKKNIDPSAVFNINGEQFVRLTNSRDIVKLELNKKRSPLSAYRIISEDFVRSIIYVEIISFNDLFISSLSYNEDLNY